MSKWWTWSENYKLEIQWDTTACSLGWHILKRLRIQSTGEALEQMEF